MHTDEDLVGVDRWDKGWRGVRIRRPSSLRYLTYRVLKILERNIAGEGKKILEVGCGGGAWMVLIAKRLKSQVYGLDYSTEGCRLAQQRLAEAALPQHVVCDDIFSAPFPPHSFDVVYSMGLIEHFQNPEELMQAMILLLKPGGQLVVGVPNMHGLLGFLHRLADRDLWLRHVPLTPEDIVRLYKVFDLDVQYADYVGTFYYTGPNWTRLLRSEKLASFVRMALAGLEIIITLPLRVFNLRVESQHFSPYVLVVGRKSADASDAAGCK